MLNESNRQLTIAQLHQRINSFYEKMVGKIIAIRGSAKLTREGIDELKQDLVQLAKENEEYFDSLLSEDEEKNKIVSFTCVEIAKFIEKVSEDVDDRIGDLDVND